MLSGYPTVLCPSLKLTRPPSCCAEPKNINDSIITIGVFKKPGLSKVKLKSISKRVGSRASF